MQSRSKARASRGAITCARSGIVVCSAIAIGSLLRPASSSAAILSERSIEPPRSADVAPVSAVDDRGAPAAQVGASPAGSGTSPTASPPALDREIVKATLDQLVQSERIDDAIRRRALDVLFAELFLKPAAAKAES